jgi:predicted nucleic acid-binding protein
MSMVLDASATMARFHANETTNAIIAVFDEIKKSPAWVPPLWKIEVANVLQRNVRKGKYDTTFCDLTLFDLSQLNIRIDLAAPQHLWTETIHLAHRHNLTVYDAIYLELAVRRSLPLATLDADLRNAAKAEGVPLLGL